MDVSIENYRLSEVIPQYLCVFNTNSKESGDIGKVEICSTTDAEPVRTTCKIPRFQYTIPRFYYKIHHFCSPGSLPPRQPPQRWQPLSSWRSLRPSHPYDRCSCSRPRRQCRCRHHHSCRVTNHRISLEESSFSIEESSFLNEIHLQLAKFYRVLSPILYVRTVILQPEMKILQYKASCPLRDIRSQEGSCQDSKTQAEAGCCSRSTHNDARRWLGLWSRPCDAALWHYFRVEHPLHVERTEVQDCNRKQSVNQRNPWKLD